jgi:hypothetical protein
MHKMHHQLEEKNKINYTKFPYYYTFMYVLSCCKKTNAKNNNIYNYALDYLTERLDIIYYLKSVEKLDKLKVLLLNYHQNVSLDYIKKPNINSQSYLDLLHINIKRDYNKEMDELVVYYKEKLEKNQMDNFDKQLIELMDPIMQNKIHSNN